jgi:hypothetical protein
VSVEQSFRDSDSHKSDGLLLFNDIIHEPGKTVTGSMSNDVLGATDANASLIGVAQADRPTCMPSDASSGDDSDSDDDTDASSGDDSDDSDSDDDTDAITGDDIDDDIAASNGRVAVTGESVHAGVTRASHWSERRRL